MRSRAIIIHSLEQARAALAAAEACGVPVALYSAEGACGYAGAAWFQAVVVAAHAAHPNARCEAVLDCGDQAGAAVAALRHGCSAIVFRGSPAVRRKLAALAASLNARLDPGAEQALDLCHAKEPQAAVAAWLAESP